jgi:pimeloyl-ACP methyl ester carboxylesterase
VRVAISAYACRMLRSSPVDGFRLASERAGAGPAVVLLHGWPVDRADYRAVTPLLSDRADVVVPDLRGFGASDKHLEDPAVAYSADAQARSVLGFPQAWGDRLGEFFSDATLRQLSGVGHFVPLEAPEAFASAVLDATERLGA